MSFQNPVFIPGPTNIPEVLRKACDMPTIDHRSPLFGQILHPARAGVKEILKSDSAEIFIFPSTGTGGWETALTNTLSKGDTVLAARNGMFSHRWIDMCQRHGLKVEIIETPWGEGAPLARIEAALKADTAGRIKAVLATHNETATGVVSDIGGIRRALTAARHDALFFVDGVSSIGSMPFEFTGWGVDIAVAGSQKGFMLPAGLAILGVSPKAMAAMETATLPRTFFDFRDMLKSYATGGYPYTPAVGLISGLAKAIEMLEDEGLEAVYARHHRLAEGVRRAVAAWGMTPCAVSADLYSNTITADDRRKLVDWCYSVVDHCQLSRETVASAMDMVDRFLSMPSNSVDAARVSDEALRDQSKFQLLTIAALYSSIKVHERVALSSDLFAEICSRTYTAEEIEDMERILLSGLSWRCHSPTAHQIGLSILSLLLPYVDIPEVTWGFLIDEMKYLTELAVRDYYFAFERTSTIALAAIFNVISDTSTKERQEILGAFLRVIMECFEFDHSKHIAAARTRLQCLVTPDILLQGDDVDEISLGESVNTFKVSNISSSPDRDRSFLV